MINIGVLFSVLGAPGALGSVGALAKGFGALAVAGAGLAVISKSTVAYHELAKELNKLNAVSGATSKEFESMKKQSLALTSVLPVTQKEVTQLQIELAKLGFTAQELPQMTDAVGKFAIAMSEDFGASAEFIGSVLRQYQLDVSEATRVTEIMAANTMLSATDMSSLAETMKYSGKG